VGRRLSWPGHCNAVLPCTVKLIQSSSSEFSDADSKLFNSIMIARPLPDDTTVSSLKELFPGAVEIAFPRHMLGARYVSHVSV